MGLILAALAVWPLVRHGHPVRIWLLAIGIVLVALGLARPRLLDPLNAACFRLGVDPMSERGGATKIWDPGPCPRESGPRATPGHRSAVAPRHPQPASYCDCRSAMAVLSSARPFRV